MLSFVLLTLTITATVETPIIETTESAPIVVQQDTAASLLETFSIAPDYLGLANASTPQTTILDSLPTTQPTTENQTIAQSQKAIVITNSIQPSMLAYKHWTGTYNPELFTITINGTEVASGSNYTLESATAPLEIRYDYSFVNGTRKGGKIISYTMNENSDSAIITFSWQDTWKVMVSNATAIKEINV